jgi:DNA-binding LacI/PurR family transcriptional regulator
MKAIDDRKRLKTAGKPIVQDVELPANGRRPTSYDVAERAGVSQSAVSRCYSPTASIAPATRERIMQAANELGYSPNALAQALISRRTNLVAVIISRLTSLYYPEVLAELTERLLSRNIRVLLFSLHAESEVDEVLDQVWRHSVDGVICAARLSDAQIQMFEHRHVPLVLYNRVSGTASAASVCCDSVAGERDLIGKLLSAGHKRFGIIAGPTDSYVGEERRVAALEALRSAGIVDVPVVRGDFSYESGGAGLRELMAERDDFDAVVCVNDLMAIGAIDVGRETFNLQIPDDLSVVGFDGSGPATWSSYRVTSVRQPVRRMTEAAVTMLVERIEDASMPAERRLFTGQFIAGRSARLD